MHSRAERRLPPVTSVGLALATAASLGLSGCAATPAADTVTVLNSATDTAEHSANQKFFDRCARPWG